MSCPTQLPELVRKDPELDFVHLGVEAELEAVVAGQGDSDRAFLVYPTPGLFVPEEQPSLQGHLDSGGLSRPHLWV